MFDEVEVFNPGSKYQVISIRLLVVTKVGNSLFDRRAMVVIKTAIDNRCFTEL